MWIMGQDGEAIRADQLVHIRINKVVDEELREDGCFVNRVLVRLEGKLPDGTWHCLGSYLDDEEWACAIRDNLVAILETEKAGVFDIPLDPMLNALSDEEMDIRDVTEELKNR